ncbi:hypothetical protein EYC84_004959 [Monilinia fructicola]|uniref:Aquaporin n=1 Tax=Monilinia fructicola TaxID=38448 RepID=A0A5M9K5I8_MONFR|nr:hypothetical protein EYC84_004959 [Monilinia fructicola]
MTTKIPITLHPQPLSASPVSDQDQDHEIQILLDDSQYCSFSPPRRVVQRSNMPIPMQDFELPRKSNDAPRHFSKIHETGYTEAQPYSAKKESFVIPNNRNDVQIDGANKSRSWMQTLQTQDTRQRYRRRRPPTKWMKWMNSEWKNPLALLQAVAPVRAILLVITQLGASCLAAILVKKIFPNRFDVATSLGSGTSMGQGFVIEAITTAALIFTIIMLAVEKHKATFIAPVGIGIALFVAHMVALPFTGASLNPARSFGPAAILGDFRRETLDLLGRANSGRWVSGFVFFRLIKLLEYEMANPGQDGDPENDPTQNPELDVAQNAQEREEELNGAGDAKSWYRDEPSFRIN